MWSLFAILINFGFWALVAEGIYAFWIGQGKNAAEKARRKKSKANNWDSKGRWILLGLVVIATFAQYA